MFLLYICKINSEKHICKTGIEKLGGFDEQQIPGHCGIAFKTKTIGKFLGSKYKVIASVGHVRDLPKSKLGIDIDNNFTPNTSPSAVRVRL